MLTDSVMATLVNSTFGYKSLGKWLGAIRLDYNLRKRQKWQVMIGCPRFGTSSWHGASGRGIKHSVPRELCLEEGSLDEPVKTTSWAAWGSPKPWMVSAIVHSTKPTILGPAESIVLRHWITGKISIYWVQPWSFVSCVQNESWW